MCKYFDISKSGYYASLKKEEKDMLNTEIILKLVQEKRTKMPRVGCKKLYFDLYEKLQDIEKIGRDKFISILRDNDLLVNIKRKYVKTTNSRHRFYKYNNLLYDKTLTIPNECWVADITYIRTVNKFLYLSLLTDAYSRKIVGWYLSNSLSIEGCLQTLKMALKQRKSKTPLIHHSDRGIQYCSNEYVNLLEKNSIDISMTEQNHCYENAIAERVNGILKNEFLLDSTFKNYDQCYKAVKEAIETYNNERPHWSLGLKTPTQVHDQKYNIAG
ncbi:MAG: IS3 family transposase [Bacteroidales bacterium]|jgi:transposase InsO family protein